jgi:hypothetical protein
MQVETRTQTAVSAVNETFADLIEVSGSTRNNILPPKGVNSLVKIDVAVGSPTADDFISLIKISGTGFKEQILTAVCFSGATSGATQSRVSIPLGSGFPMSDVTDLNISYAQCSGGNLTQDVSVSLFFE